MQKEQGVSRKLVGIEMAERAIPRHGYRLLAADEDIGQVTSGTYAPWLNKSVGMGYVSKSFARTGTPLDVEIRGKAARATVTKLPFYKRETGV